MELFPLNHLKEFTTNNYFSIRIETNEYYKNNIDLKNIYKITVSKDNYYNIFYKKYNSFKILKTDKTKIYLIRINFKNCYKCKQEFNLYSVYNNNFIWNKYYDFDKYVYCRICSLY